MNKTLLALVVTGSIALAGCSSSDGAHSNTESSPDRLPPIWSGPNEADIEEAPSRLPPVWGGPSIPETEETPDRLPPTWTGPEQPPMWNDPEYSYLVSGNTITDAEGNEYTISNISWKSHEFSVLDADGNSFDIRMIREGEHAGSYYVFDGRDGIYIGGDVIKGGISPMMETPSHQVDRQTVRDAIRNRLNR
ncbi:hypothetical protein [Vibrio sonorensis]|uniref:hypothetical protein n=1 Tax=Vibrio sonorensis TaxID=1004316 RepID=UPI0008D99B97|nr:hypothetical protein [Vibrio sonorensis]